MWSKLLFLAIAIVAIWYAFKILNRPSKSGATPPAIEPTIQCARCGVYVPKVNAAPCGRDGCPYLPLTDASAP